MYKYLLKNSDFSKINNYFRYIKLNSNKIESLINSLEDIGDIIVVGGTIRDILIKEEPPRDIDIIIDTSDDLDFIFNKYERCLKNRFGGYKLRIDDIEFDIWSIENHWAFKERILKKNVLNLKYSTFLNFDALFYNLSRKYIDFDLFNECISSNMLEITLNDDFIDRNPSKEINILRMILIRDEWGLNLSEKCTNYITRWLQNNENSVDNLYSAQFKHYKFEKIPHSNIQNMISEFV